MISIYLYIMATEDVTAAQWDEKVLSQDYVAVDFWAEWCAFCKQLAPIYEEVSNEVTDTKFVKVNVGNEMDLAQKYGVQGIPVIKFFCNGKEVGSVVGLRTKDQLKQDVARVRAEAESCAANSSEMKQ